MYDLVRDSTFGRLVRLATGSKVFSYPEERDPSLWKKYVHEEKSGFAAHHGHTGPHREGSYAEPTIQPLGGIRTREGMNDGMASDGSASSERTLRGQLPDDGHTYNNASGMRVDPEKGKDIHVIDWYGPDDADVRNTLSQILRTMANNRTRIQGIGLKQRNSS